MNIAENKYLPEGQMYNVNGLVQCGPETYATLMVYVDFQGRDRRRIKREVNKAVRRVRRKKRGNE